MLYKFVDLPNYFFQKIYHFGFFLSLLFSFLTGSTPAAPLSITHLQSYRSRAVDRTRWQAERWGSGLSPGPVNAAPGGEPCRGLGYLDTPRDARPARFALGLQELFSGVVFFLNQEAIARMLPAFRWVPVLFPERRFQRRPGCCSAPGAGRDSRRCHPCFHLALLYRKPTLHLMWLLVIIISLGTLIESIE